MKTIEKITDAINPTLGMSIVVLLLTILFSIFKHVALKYAVWINGMLIIIVIITIFFMIRHALKK